MWYRYHGIGLLRGIPHVCLVIPHRYHMKYFGICDTTLVLKHANFPWYTVDANRMERHLVSVFVDETKFEAFMPHFTTIKTSSLPCFGDTNIHSCDIQLESLSSTSREI